MDSGIICQLCGIESPTRRVCFYQNIGMLVMRRHQRLEAMLCKRCVHKHFWKMTATTLFLGPWGTISLFASPIFIINNTVRYIAVAGMPAVAADAAVPVLTEQAAKKLQPLTKEIIDRVNKAEPLVAVANDVARRAKVTPGQVVKYVGALSQANRPQPAGQMPNANA